MTWPQTPLAQSPQSGAALLTALLIMTLVTTLAASMAWARWRDIAIEAAERDRLQAQWILTPAIDWSRLLLRVDARTSSIDHPGEAWALPLAPARLSAFLSTGSSAADSDEDPAFVSGRTEDAQARLNIRNLVGADGTPSAPWRIVFETLYRHLGLSSPRVGALQTQLIRAVAAQGSGAATGAASTPLLPHTLDQLAWLGMSQMEIKTLSPYIAILPERTPVNVNTAPLAVLQALLPMATGASLQRLVSQRNASPFERIDEARSILEESTPGVMDENLGEKLSVGTQYFLLRGALRRGDRTLAQQVLLQRKGMRVRVLEHAAFASTHDDRGAP